MAYRTTEGRWRAQPRARDGRLSKTFRTKAAAERWEREVLDRIERGADCGTADPEALLTHRASSETTTFREFGKRWLEGYCKIEKAPSQYVEDGKALRVHLYPAFGDRLLGELRKGDLQALRVALATRKKPKTVNNVVGLAKKVLATAVEWDVLAANPWSGVKPLPLGDQPADYWTPDERDAILALAKRDRPALADLLTFAAHTGMRRGELAGLTWAQVDWDRSMVLVNAVWCYKSGQRLLRTKTRLIRYVPLNAPALSVLVRLKAGGGGGRGAAVFDRTLCRQANDQLRRLCKRLKVKRVRLHDMRHTFCSALAMAGVDRTKRKALAGHRTEAMQDRYVHLEPEFLRSAVDAIAGPGTGLAPVPRGASASA